MSLQLRRACAFLALSLAIVLLPAAAQAIPAVTPVASSAEASANSGVATDITLVADEEVEATIRFDITAMPTHGTLVLGDDHHCVFPDQGGVHCTITATYASNPGYSGSDAFTYTATDGSSHTSAPATVTIAVVGPTPPPAPTPTPTPTPAMPVQPAIDGPTTASANSDWVATVSSLLVGATVDYGDLSGTKAITVSSLGTGLLSHAYPTPGSYMVTVTNTTSAGSTTRTAPVTVQAVTASTPSQVTVPPMATGSMASPGLYVSVISGMISISATGRTSFQAGQFGFTPSFTQPPIILPPNPGIRFTPPPAFSQAKVLSTTQLTVKGADAASSAQVDVTYAKKMYCNRRSAARATQGVDCIVRSLHASAATPVTPELWFIAADGTLQPVVSSTKPGAASGINAKSGVITMTLDATSTPTLASLARTTSFAALVRARGKAVSAIRRTTAPSAVRWPQAGTRISTGVVFTCPKASTRSCSVRVRAVSTQFGVRRVVGARTLHVRAGSTAPLDFTLARPGRWRLATRGLVATLTADAVAYQPKATHEGRTFGLRVRLPR